MAQVLTGEAAVAFQQPAILSGISPRAVPDSAPGRRLLRKAPSDALFSHSDEGGARLDKHPIGRSEKVGAFDLTRPPHVTPTRAAACAESSRGTRMLAYRSVGWSSMYVRARTLLVPITARGRQTPAKLKLNLRGICATSASAPGAACEFAEARDKNSDENALCPHPALDPRGHDAASGRRLGRLL